MSGTKQGISQILDIDICDEKGKVCARFKGLEIKEYTETNPQNEIISEAQEPYQLMTFEEVWQEQAFRSHLQSN